MKSSKKQPLINRTVRHPLYKHRIALGLTQYELADILDCSQKAISRMERGGDQKPSKNKKSQRNNEIPPFLARVLLKYAKSVGVKITMDSLYDY